MYNLLYIIAEEEEEEAVLDLLNEKSNLKLKGNLSSNNNNLYIHLIIENLSDDPLKGVVLQLDKNTLGLKPENNKITLEPPLERKAKYETRVLLERNSDYVKESKDLNIAIKNKTTKKISYFKIPLDKSVLFKKNKV